jgi:uncharacterized protein DUF2784
MAYRWLALAVVGLHFAYLAYLLFGGFLAWRWPRSWFVHLLAASWATLVITTAVPCPLTAVQNWLRERGGQPPVTGGFIARYVRGVFYPADHETAAQVAVGLLVAVSWTGLAVRLARLRARVHREPPSGGGPGSSQ